MSNRRYGTAKELPYIWYEIDAVESWLDEQAQQGLRFCVEIGKLRLGIGAQEGGGTVGLATEEHGRQKEGQYA